MHLGSFHSAYLCTPNVCDNNVYKAQTCTSFHYLIVLTRNVQDDGNVEVDELPEPRGSLANDIPYSRKVWLGEIW